MVFAYGAGLLTLINPCVLPILPIVLASAMQGGRLGPVWLMAGMGVSFVVVGVGVTAFGRAIGLTAERMGDAGAVMMILFGLVLLIPRLSAQFATATAGIASGANSNVDRIAAAGPGNVGPRAQFAGGALMGAVWSPCIGPTLGAAIALASQGQSLARVTLIMVFFALGVATVMLALAYGSRKALAGRQERLRRIAPIARPLLGGSFVVVGIAILLRWHWALEGAVLRMMPHWLVDLSVSL